MIPRIAVVPTHDRPAELRRLLDALAPQCHAVFVIDNASTPPVSLPRSWPLTPDRGWLPVDIDAALQLGGGPSMRVHVIRDEEQPPNLYRLWNVGLEAAADYVRGGDVTGYDVAILNDDADVPPGWWNAVSGPLRAHSTAVVGCTGAYEPVSGPQLRTAPDNDLYGRMTPWAWVAKGEAGQRADERFRWWWGDTDWDWRARALGGVLTVPGPVVRNTGANTSTVGALAEQAGRDRATFIELHGRAPW